MITWVTVVKAIIVMIGTFVTTGLPLIIKFVQANKARKTAETEAEKVKAYNDMLATMQAFVESAEKAFDGYDRILKEKGESAGAMKKDNVLSKLQTYALQRGYDFDISFWDNQIDEFVAVTKQVNAKKKAQ